MGERYAPAVKASLSRQWLAIGLPLIVVICGLAGYFSLRGAEAEKDAIRDRIGVNATLATATLDEYLTGRLDLLQTIVTRAAFLRTDRDAIAGDIGRVNPPARGFAGGLVWVDRAGAARAPRGAAPVDAAIVPQIQSVLRTGGPVISDGLAGATPATPVFVLAVPTRDGAGEITGALIATSRVSDLTVLARQLRPDEEQTRIVDRAGTLLLPLAPTGEVSMVAPGSPYERMRAAGTGVIDADIGLTGMPDRVIGFKISAASGWLVAHAERRREAFAGPVRTQRLELITLAVAGALLAMGLVFASGQEARITRERESLLAAERSARARSEILERTAEHLVSARTSSEIADSVVADIRAWGADIANLRLVRWDRSAEVLVSEGIDEQLVRGMWVDALPAGSMAADAAHRNEALVAQTGAEYDGRYPEWAEARRDNEAESVMALPLHSTDGRVAGILAAASREPHWLTEDRQKALRGIAEQCDLALERALLQARADTAALDTDLLDRVSDSLSRATTVNERARRLAELLHAEGVGRTVVQVVDGATSICRVVAPPDGTGHDAADDARVDEQIALTVTTGDPRDDHAAALSVIPLRARGRTLGALAIIQNPDAEGRRMLAPALSREIALRAAFAIDNALMYERERDVSRTLQIGLLGGADLEVPDADIANAYRPGTAALDVGGDWYDAFPLAGERLALVVGDVVGHSIDAAVAMGQLRGAVRALAPLGEPGQVLAHLDTFVISLPAAQMATIAYVVLDRTTGDFSYACAGHPPPLCVSTEGEARLLWEGRSAPLGTHPEGPRAEAAGRLGPGEALVLYTDGLIERRGESIDIGLDRLVATARVTPYGSAALVEHLCDALLTDEEQHDDVCVMALRRVAVAGEFAHRLAAVPGDLAGLRRELRSWLERRDIGVEPTHAIVLAISEAAANAVEHGYRSNGIGVVEVLARCDDKVFDATVRDRGGWREPRVDPHRGRGIAIMRSLMDNVSIASDADATVVQMRKVMSGDPSSQEVMQPAAPLVEG